MKCLVAKSVCCLQSLVVKPDQLIKRRGKLGLIHVKGNSDSVRSWISERIDKPIKIERAEGRLKNFIVEPFLPHQDDEEAYVCIYSTRDCDVILFHKQGKIFRDGHLRLWESRRFNEAWAKRRYGTSSTERGNLLELRKLSRCETSRFGHFLLREFALVDDLRASGV